jgi:GAF domain-containing protein
MNNSAILAQNQPSLTASLAPSSHPAQAFSADWSEISSQLEAFTHEAALAFTVTASCLYILDQNQSLLTPYFTSGASLAHFPPQELGHGLVGQAAQSKQLKLKDNLNSRSKKSPLLDYPASFALAAPLLAAGEVMGVILLVNTHKLPGVSALLEAQLNSFIEKSRVAWVIKNAGLVRPRVSWQQALTTLNHTSQTLNFSLHSMEVDDVCRTILEKPGLKEIFQFDIAEICLWSSQSKTLTTALRVADTFQYERTYRLQQGYTGWIAHTQQPLVIKDTHNYPAVLPEAGPANFPYRAYVGVPLKIGARLLGTLELAAAPVGLYDQADVSLLEVIANHAAITIDHARLFQETQRNLSKLSLLFDTSLDLSSRLSFDELVRELSDRLAEIFAADACVLYSFDEAANTLQLIEQSALAQQFIHSNALPSTVTRFPVLQTAVKTQAPVAISLNGPATNPHEQAWLNQENFGTMVAVPLIVRDKVTGLMQLLAKNPHAFTEDDIWLAQSLANQVSIAIENARLFNLTDQQLQKRLNELDGLQRVSGELNNTLDLNHILNLVLEEAIRVTQADFGNVNLYDANTGTLVAHKEQGWPDTFQVDLSDANSSARTAPAQLGIMGRALHSGKAILVADVLKDKDYINLGDVETRSKVVIPIIYGGESAGVINLESKQLDFFNQDQLHYLEVLANQAAVAIGNTQAYQEQKQERERANRRTDLLARLSEISNTFWTNRPLPEILEDIAYAIAELVGYNTVLISLVEGNPPAIHHKVAAGIPVAQVELLINSTPPRPLKNLQAVMQEEFRLDNSYFVPAERREVWQNKLDVPEQDGSGQTGNFLFAPLSDTQDQIIGLLTVETPLLSEHPDAFLAQTLEIFANHAAAAIENARMFEREQQRRRLTDTLRDVAEAISSQLDFDQLLNVVLQELIKVVDYDSASVQLLRGDQLVIVGSQGWTQPVIGRSFSVQGNNPSRVVVETQEPHIVGDVRAIYPITFANPPYNHIRGWLGVPLTYGINVLGLIALDSTQPDFFSRDDAEVLFAFANQVAVAWQNARLFEATRQQVRQLAALTEVAQSLNRALDLNEVLNLVLDAVFDLVGMNKGSIWLIDNVTSTVKIASTKNLPEFLIELFNASAIPVDSEPFASVIRSNQVQVIKGNVDKDHVAHYGSPFPGDVTYVPLATEESVIGILAIETIIHDKNMLALVSTLADLAAVAIEGARLLENTRQRANEMQNLYRLGVEVSGLLDLRQLVCSVVSNALTLTNTHIGVILFRDEENKSYIIDAALNSENPVAQFILNEVKEIPVIESNEETFVSLWASLTRQIMTTGQPMVIASDTPVVVGEETPPRRNRKITDTQLTVKHALPIGVRAMLGVPIQVQNQTMGAIFAATLAWRNFDDHDVQLLSFVANQAAVAIRNAQLVRRLNLFNEELERRVALRTEELGKTLEDLTEERDRVEALYQITRELSISFDLDRVLVEALSLINRAVGISQGAILLLDPETGSLLYRAALGRDRPLPRGGLITSYRPSYGLAGKVIEARQSRIIPDLLADPDWLPSTENPYERRSGLAVPLMTGEEVLGVLLLFHPEIDYFSEDHLKLVNAAAAQIATAINNAELYRLITDQAQRLGVMLRNQAAETGKNEAILLGITDGVLVLDAKRHIALVNPKATEILNLNPEKLTNQSIHQSFGEVAALAGTELASLFYQNLLKALALIEAGERSAEFRMEADKKALAVSLAPVAVGGDEIPTVVAVIRDISRDAEIDRLKNEFISTVSHELRTPMTSIKGYADLLVGGSAQVGELNPIQRRFVEVIQANANRLTELVNDILEISRIETGKVKLETEPVDLLQVIKEAAVSFEGQMVNKAMNFSLNLSDALPYVLADRARVIQILVNLIGNAWQYTPEGGNIMVRAHLASAHLVQVDVEDNGIGIPDKDVPFIFDRFFRSERTEVQVVDGTGLGLSITRMFVEMLGGKIWVDSKLDEGSTFSFTLPIAPTFIAQVGGGF